MKETSETIKLIKEALGKPILDPLTLAKTAGWQQPSTSITGVTQYELESAIMQLYPWGAYLTPLRNQTPRNKAPFGSTAVNFQTLDGINTAKLPAGVSQGNRAGQLTHTTSRHTMTYKGIGHEDSVDFEAQYSAEGFLDLRAQAQESAMKSLMLDEERMQLWGLSGDTSAWQFGTPSKPVGTKKAGGSMAAQATLCYVVALTLEGLINSGGPGTASGTNMAVPTTVAVTNAGPYGGTETHFAGASHISVAADAITTETSNLSVSWTVTAVPGAAGYAWFTGITNPAGCSLNQITTTNLFLQTLDAAGTQNAGFSGSTVDHSYDQYSFDGLIPQLVNASSGAFYKSLDGANLTGNGDGSITEIDDILQNAFDKYRLGYDGIWCSSADFRMLRNKVVSPGGTSNYRIILGKEGESQIQGGALIQSYVSPYMGKTLDITVHPNLPQGTMLFYSKSIPYENANVKNITEVETRREYYSQDWPIVTRKYEYGVYADETFKLKVPFAYFCLQNFGSA